LIDEFEYKLSSCTPDEEAGATTRRARFCLWRLLDLASSEIGQKWAAVFRLQITLNVSFLMWPNRAVFNAVPACEKELKFRLSRSLKCSYIKKAQRFLATTDLN